MTLKIFVSERVHHLYQGSIEHFHIVRTFLNKMLVYLVIAVISQCELHMLRAFKSYLTNIAVHSFLKREALIICETNLYQVADEFVNLSFSMVCAWHESSRIL